MNHLPWIMTKSNDFLHLVIFSLKFQVNPLLECVNSLNFCGFS